MIAKCFRCQEGYDTQNPDDLEGDGKCLKCKEITQKIAFDIDLKFANRMKESRPKSNVERYMEAFQRNGGVVRLGDY